VHVESKVLEAPPCLCHPEPNLACQRRSAALNYHLDLPVAFRLQVGAEHDLVPEPPTARLRGGGERLQRIEVEVLQVIAK
jgi:hypothetical protein